MHDPIEEALELTYLSTASHVIPCLDERVLRKIKRSLARREAEIRMAKKPVGMFTERLKKGFFGIRVHAPSIVTDGRGD